MTAALRPKVYDFELLGARPGRSIPVCVERQNSRGFLNLIVIGHSRIMVGLESAPCYCQRRASNPWLAARYDFTIGRWVWKFCGAQNLRALLRPGRARSAL